MLALSTHLAVRFEQASLLAAPTIYTATQANRVLQYAYRYPYASLLRPVACYVTLLLQWWGQMKFTSWKISLLGTSTLMMSTLLYRLPQLHHQHCSVVWSKRKVPGTSHALSDIGHPQSAALIIYDNKCAVGFVNRTVKQKRSKCISGRF
jgi:hypothetical protein